MHRRQRQRRKSGPTALQWTAAGRELEKTRGADAGRKPRMILWEAHARMHACMVGWQEDVPFPFVPPISMRWVEGVNVAKR